MAKFREILNRSKHVVVLSGAGVSAESGIPTFRGSGGFWRTYQAQDLATPGAFARDPSLVWEFYHYRRELVLTKEPNKVLYQLNKYFPKLMHILGHFPSSVSLEN
jgi:NAD-dependent SIR2 family protein deacetylase